VSRIIAGSHGGRRLTMPAGDRTRPTSDRVREALFSVIASWAGTTAGAAAQSLSDLAFCDLYAGSGAVGLEAASRGAGPVLLVEGDRRTSLITRRNARDLDLEVDVSVADVEQLLRQPATQSFDVIFADPPYELDSARLDEQLRLMVLNGWLAAAGLVVVERSRRSVALEWPPEFSEISTRTYGETVLYLASLDHEGSS
jgi:16S rRNA (guanine966-N2)-methyltransferase